MYSLLLMTALSAGPDTASFGGRFSHGCCGGYPVSCYGCCGYSYGCCGYSYGCCGYSYGCCGYSYGCCGGYSSCYGGGGLFHHKHSYSYGCCGYSYGCCGYSYGCCGGYYSAYAGCCGGCYGSAYGGCYGSWYGASYGTTYGSSCFGYGVIVGGPTIVTPGVITMPPAGTTVVPAVPAAPAVDTKDGKDNKSSSTTVDKPASSAARLTIELPASARLIVDGQTTRGEGATRQFHTPALPVGQAFFYEMRAEMEIDGKVEVEEKRVVVRAGEALTESFAKLTAAAAGAKSTAVAAK